MPPMLLARADEVMSLRRNDPLLWVVDSAD
jgi:hypothetical protein